MEPTTERPSLAELLSPQFFKALCDPTRLSILGDLTRIVGPSTVGRIAACCTIDLSVVSRHLATLREAGILRSEKRGKEVYYTLQAEEVVAKLRELADAIESCCAPPKEESHEPDQT